MNEADSFSETDSFTSGKEIYLLLWDAKFQCHIQKSSALNPVYTITYYFSVVRLNIIIPLRLVFQVFSSTQVFQLT
jgi:hypothetical protein